MTDPEIITTLATRVMGWREWTRGERPDGTYFAIQADVAIVKDSQGEFARHWNPLESIADAFELQAAVIAAGKGDEYARRLVADLADAEYAAASIWYASEADWLAIATASPRDRCMAVISMLESEVSDEAN